MDKYSQRGVSSQKEDVHKAIEKLDKGLYPNAFAKSLPDFLCNDQNYCNIIHADGAGTKSSLAYAYWKETGDMTVWHNIVQDAIVMNTDDLLCVGVYDNFLISNTIGRNKNFIPGKVLSEIIQGFSFFIKKMKNLNINIIMGGGETADIGDLVRTIVIDTTVTVRTKRENIIPVDIKHGDVIVGLASSGKAIYEDEYNSGIASNGLTLARHELFNKNLANKYPETYDDNLNENLVYTGKYNLTDKVPGFENFTVGKFLLSPTRTYLPIMAEVIPQFKSKINGIIHCTGGGQTKVMKFVKNNLRIVKNNLFDIPLIFKLIQQSGNISFKEMYSVFNMGHLLEIYTDEKTALKIIDISHKFSVEAKIIGFVEKNTKPLLQIKSPDFELNYEKF